MNEKDPKAIGKNLPGEQITLTNKEIRISTWLTNFPIDTSN